MGDATQLIKRGFNDGYIMEVNAPEHAQIIARGFAQTENPYAKAFIEGRNERISERELEKERSPRTFSHEPNNELEIDFGVKSFSHFFLGFILALDGLLTIYMNHFLKSYGLPMPVASVGGIWVLSSNSVCMTYQGMKDSKLPGRGDNLSEDPVKNAEVLNDWVAEKSKRNYLFMNLYEAKSRLVNFKVSFSVQKKEPMYGEIRFVHQDLRRFDSLKMYVGEYGFVVPVKGSKNKKVLKGEKMLKYKHLEVSIQR